MWILEKHSSPQSSMEEISQSVQGFLQIVLGEVHTAVNSALSEASIDVSSLSSVFFSLIQCLDLLSAVFKRNTCS